IKEVNKRISELNINRNIIVELSAVNEKLINLNNKLEEAIHEAEEYDNDLKKHEETLKLKRSDKEKAEVIRNAAYKEYDQLLAYSSEAAKGVRALVRVGDLCPVCGQKVMKHLKDNIFDEISRSTLEAKTQAEEQYNRVEAEIIAENKIIDELKKSINKILKRIEETKNEKIIFSSNYSSLIQKSGLSIKEPDNLQPLLEKELNDIKQRIEKEEKSQQHYIELSEELKTIQASEASRSAKLETIKSQIKNTEEDLTIWKTTLKEKNERLAECNDKLRLFFLTNKNIEEKRLEELNKLDSLFITTLEEEIQKTRDSLNSETGGLEALRNEIKILNERKPKFDENESISELEKEKKNLENKIKEIDVRFGVLNERLRLNDENLTKIEIKKKEEEEIRSEKEQWESLYKYLGDQDGMKFRAVAQSFILKSLLYNANAYMSTFSARYTLTGNPGSLAILVKDELHPSEPQPVSILS
ncbi:MAG: hypothetical protein K2K58_04270, partial [Muribaculaceae bacterium]|nr:hypothetical protein [Muribaculaceae bacterium]